MDQEFPIVARMGLASDITYLKTGEGFIYHCGIRYTVTEDVLGDHIADLMTKNSRSTRSWECWHITNWPRGVSFTVTQRQPIHVKSRDGVTAAIWAESELLASRDAVRQCMVGKLLRDHEERGDTLDALRDKKSRLNTLHQIRHCLMAPTYSSRASCSV